MTNVSLYFVAISFRYLSLAFEDSNVFQFNGTQDQVVGYTDYPSLDDAVVKKLEAASI